MTIHIRKSNEAIRGYATSIGIILILLYAYSRLSWGLFIPSIGWGAMLALASVLFLFTLIFRLNKSRTVDGCSVLFALMLGIMIANNNYDLKQLGFFNSIFPYVCMFILYIACSRNGKWIGAAVAIMVFFGLFYALFTFICDIFPQIYYSMIYPLMSRYGTSYTAHPSAGFTAHYSTNGIYLAMGFCAMTGITYFRYNGRLLRVPWWKLIFPGIMTIALFICGKRGILLCLMVALFICYLWFTAKKKRGRMIKMIGALLAAAVVIYVLSFFIPSITYVIERFTRESKKGDMSNGRFALWAYATAHIGQKPWTGHGWRWFKYHNPIMIDADVHNCYLQLVLETGILGCIPFFAFFGISFIRAAKLAVHIRKKQTFLSNRDIAYIYIAAMNEMFMLPFMFEGTALYMPECMITYFLSCAIVEYYRKKLARKVS